MQPGDLYFLEAAGECNAMWLVIAVCQKPTQLSSSPCCSTEIMIRPDGTWKLTTWSCDPVFLHRHDVALLIRSQPSDGGTK